MFILLISNHTVFLVQFGINLHLWVFQKAEIALAEAARAISAFWKTHSCKLIPNWTRNRMITYTNKLILIDSSSQNNCHAYEKLCGQWDGGTLLRAQHSLKPEFEKWPSKMCSNEEFIRQDMKNKTIYFRKWPSIGHLDTHLAKSLHGFGHNNKACTMGLHSYWLLLYTHTFVLLYIYNARYSLF